IGILVGLLSVALNSTKERAFRIICLDHMKQLQMAWLMYADDNEDHLALNKTAPGPLDKRLLGRRLSTNSWAAGNPREDRTTANIERGTLFPYLRSTEIYKCPQDSSRVAGGSGLPRVRSYSVNAYLGGDNAGLDPRVKTRLTELAQPGPDRVFVFIEEHEHSIWSSGFEVLPRDKFTLSSGSWSSTPSDRHMQGANLSFADGHVEYWRWRSPKSDNLYNRITTDSKELADLRRLQTAVPRH
ncbi:MAG: hypothetical protein SFY81_07715, partial [Verrucomicrobiota bacterium]|nr:hypothetical protein [Verrucomicrobiota bacterium]